MCIFLKGLLKYLLLISVIQILASSNNLLFADLCTPYLPGQYSVSMALDPWGNPHVAWEQDLVSWETSSYRCVQNDIYYTHSIDKGKTFLHATADIDRIPFTQARVSLAIDPNGNPAVVWADTRESKKYVYFSRSIDGGGTFSPGIRIDSSPEPQERPKLKFDADGNPVIVWIKTHHYEAYMNPVGYIYVTKSVDGGYTFLPSVPVSGNLRPRRYLGWPSLTIDAQNNPLVVLHYYSEWNKSWNAYFVRSFDQGASFAKPVLIEKSSYDQYVAGDHVLVVDSDDNPYIALTDSRNGDWNIRLARSVDSGSSFLPSISIDSYPTRQITPSLAIDSSDNLYIAWADGRTGVTNVRFTMSEDRGVTFRESMLVDEKSFLQNRPSLDVDLDLGVVHIAWSDNSQGRLYLYYTKSVDNGASFTPSIPVYPFPPEMN